jgi:K+-sensing histidine kinase KdpD
LYETDNLKLKKEEVLIYSLIKELFDNFNQERFKSNKDKVTLLLNVHDSLKSVRILTDGHRLSRVISCLIGNAIAIKNKGSVEIGAELIDKNHIVFSVKEDGSKLILERAKKVFENNDSEEDLINSSDAIGLGYKLAKGIVEKMGGDIKLEDNALNGSIIGFVLPVEVVKQTVRIERDSKSARSLQA